MIEIKWSVSLYVKLLEYLLLVNDNISFVPAWELDTAVPPSEGRKMGESIGNVILVRHVNDY